MLYAILLPLRRWVQWLRADVLHWLQTHNRLEPGYGQAAIELVTPVEELEPYFIEESHDGATIVLTVRCIPNGEGIAFRYCPGWGGNVFHSEEQFRQHAVAERDCLNAEYRKEMGK